MRTFMVSFFVGCLGAVLTAAGFLACSTGTGGTGPIEDASVDAAETSVEPDILDVMVADVGKDVVVVDAADARAMDVTTTDVEAQDGPTEAAGDVQEEQPPACDEQNCGGACCGGRCVPRTCAGCAAGGNFCPFHAGVSGVNGYCVSDCSSCDAGGTPAALTCFSCTGATPAGRCAVSPNECPPADAGACPCAPGDAGACPGATQVCTGLACLTCGQPSTDAQTCANGKGCSEQSATCN